MKYQYLSVNCLMLYTKSSFRTPYLVSAGELGFLTGVRRYGVHPYPASPSRCPGHSRLSSRALSSDSSNIRLSWADPYHLTTALVISKSNVHTNCTLMVGYPFLHRNSSLSGPPGEMILTCVPSTAPVTPAILII